MPLWVGDHQRRLVAYQILQSYIDNSARWFLATTDESVVNQHREYGDPSLIRDAVLDALLGNEQTIDTEGADDYDPAEDAQNEPGAQTAFDMREWLQERWTEERGPLCLIEVERDAVGLGDGVYTLGWDTEKNRARISVWDPGFYFPVLDTSTHTGDFPSRVHIAWEETNIVQGRTERKVRRLTWDLRRIDTAKRYPWNEKPSNYACFYSDATWSQSERVREIDDLSPETAVYSEAPDGTELRDLDLGIDFIPVVHIPNTVALKDHYGQSSLAKVLQLLDDIAGADTGLAEAAVTAANPTVLLEKARMAENPTWKAGEVWEVGDGKASLLDTSRSLVALADYLATLLSRMETNSRLPAALLGRLKPSEVPSGVALALSFGPLSAMIGKMRLSRDEKYPLLLKFLWRMHRINDSANTPAEWVESSLLFGSFLPTDEQQVITSVTGLYQADLISRETAIKVLQAAGYEVDDIDAEVLRIQEADFVGAGELAAATGRKQDAIDYLGLEGEALPAPEPFNPDVPGPAEGVPPQVEL